MSRRPTESPRINSTPGPPAGAGPRACATSTKSVLCAGAASRRRRPAAPRPSRLPGGCLILVAVVVLLFILGPILLELSVDWQWFGSLGLQSVYGTRLTAAIGVFFAGLVVAALFFALNWLIARRIAVPRDLFPGQQLDISQRRIGPGYCRGGRRSSACSWALLPRASGPRRSTISITRLSAPPTRSSSKTSASTSLSCPSTTFCAPGRRRWLCWP